MIGLLIGILIAVGIFGATLFCVHQAVTTKAIQRVANSISIVCVIGAMAAISNIYPVLAQICGLLLAVSSCIVIVKTPGWNRIMPIILLVFAVALVMKLPFA